MFSSSSNTQQQSSNDQGIEKFLSYNYRTTGNIVKLKDHTEFYGNGDPRSKHGVIMIPDTMGWNAGRIRNIADFYAANDCYVAIPKLMGSSGQQGSAPSYFESENMGQYMKGLTFDAHLKPKISSILNFMKAEGIEKISIVGFSWGGWVATNVLASDLAENFVCGILAHPTIDLEEKMYGGNTAELFSHIQRPVLLLPARGDPYEYTALARLLKYKCPTTEVIDYHELEHGFLIRGNIDNEQTKRACSKSLKEILSYLQHHFKVAVKDLVRDLGDDARLFVGESYGEKHKTWWEMGRERVEQAQQGMSEGYDRMKQGMQNAGQQMQEGWDKTKQQTQEGWDKTKQQTQEGWDKTKQQTQEGWDKTKQQAQEGYEGAKERSNQAGQQMQEGWDKTKQQAQEGYEGAKERTNQAGQQMQEGYDHTKDQAQKGSQEHEQRRQQDQEHQQRQQRQQEDKSSKGKSK